MKSVLVVALFTFPAFVAYAESWLCISDKSTGFRYEDSTETWSPLIFKASGKYLIRRPKQDDVKFGRPHEWVVAAFGMDKAMSECEEFNEAGMLHCQGTPDFKFSRKLLRFIAVTDSLYFFEGKDVFDSPNLPDMLFEIGTCTPI